MYPSGDGGRQLVVKACSIFAGFDKCNAQLRKTIIPA
jgi:hypothetical protein